MKNDNPEQVYADRVGGTRRYMLNGDAVWRGTAAYDDETRAALRWLHTHCWEENIPLADVAALIKRADGQAYDRNTLYKALTGKHEAKLDNIVKAINDYKALVDERRGITRLPFIETALTRRIFEVCNNSRLFQKMVFIYGESQIGKTTALEEYATQNNHGATIYVRMPTTGSMRAILDEIAHVMRFTSAHVKEHQLRDRIVRAFDSRMLLIVDEAHQVFLGGASVSRIRTFELIREIHDRCKCGVVICGTPVLESQIKEGEHRKLLRQFTLRSLLTLRLPDKPAKKDLNTISRQYGLAPAEDEALMLQSEVIDDHGLGRWCTILQCASRIASTTKAKLTWEHVLEAHAGLISLETGK